MKRIISKQNALLSNIVDRIVSVAHPEKIILFGSRARNDASQFSDIDLLIVKKGAHRRKLAFEIYRNLIGVGCPVDLVVVTPEDIEKYGNSPSLIIHPALKEGKVVYAL
jgi:predicted nucleotidyltransferase